MMPRGKQARHTDVKDIRSILRLTFEQELSMRAVSERLKMSKTSVSTYLLRAREAGLAVWPLPPGVDDDEVLEQRLFRRMGRPPRDSDEPNWPKVASELKRKGVTLHLAVAAGTSLLIVGKVVFNTLARQVCRQRLAPRFFPV